MEIIGFVITILAFLIALYEMFSEKLFWKIIKNSKTNLFHKKRLISIFKIKSSIDIDYMTDTKLMNNVYSLLLKLKEYKIKIKDISCFYRSSNKHNFNKRILKAVKSLSDIQLIDKIDKYDMNTDIRLHHSILDSDY